MHTDNLIRMANQIGAFFEAMPDRPEALENAARHIRSFWEPRMRRALLAHVDGHEMALATAVPVHGHHDDVREPQELSPFIVEALATHRGMVA